jgi:tetratricopeptide (TPR) repeat protein
VARRGASALGWQLQGELLFAQKQYQLAHESLLRSSELSNENYRAHQLIGLIHIVGRRDLEAGEELQIAAQQNPNSPQARFFLGRIYYRRGQPARARDEFLACLRIQADYPKATENLGLCYEALQDIPKAIDAYERAIHLEKVGKTPPSEDPYVEYAVLMANQGETEKSISLLKEGLSKNPRSARAKF